MDKLGVRRRRLLDVLAARALAGPVLASTGALQVMSARAQSGWPAKPIRLLLGFPPGGAIEYIARAVQDGLEAALGQPLVIEYRPGEGGALAATEVARALPDGYTLLVANTAPFVIAPHLLPRPSYEPLRQFAYIGQISEANYIAAARADHPAHDLRQFIEWVKAFEGRAAFASAGVGTTSHLNGELFNSVAGVELQHRPYSSSAAAMTDLIGGRVHLIIDAGTTLLPEIKRGRLRALAVTGPRRDSNLPAVSTVAEQGLPGLQSVGFQGLVGPASLPEPIVQRLATELIKVLAMPEVRKRLKDAGTEPQPRDPQQFAAFVRSESERWSALIALRGIGRE